MSSLPTVLIFTYSEYGQANVNLATSYELALAGVNVYIASFPPLRPRVSRIQERIDRHRSSGEPIGSVTFCECKGFPSFIEAFTNQGATPSNLTHSHGVLGALESYPKIDVLIFPWNLDEHIVAIESCKEIIATIKPNVAVVDMSFYMAQDACKLAGQKFMIMSPNAIKDVALSLQPYLAALWKYPALSSGFSFPLKWWQVPLNIYLSIRLFIQLRSSEKITQIRALRRSLGLKHTFGDKSHFLYSGVTSICPALAETDFPFAVIPEEILLCGPIIIPFDPLEESDPTLMKWLDNGPTVMVNLGSHVIFDGRVAREVASAFRILLDYHEQRGTSKIQILWKAKANGDIQTVIDEIIGKEIKEGRVRVLPWLEAEPVAVLQHPNVICAAHHGGANSFYEGVWSGVPHIVLPVWHDTFDYASRVEFLKIGIFGNKTSGRSIEAKEFGEALVRVTGDTEEADEFRRSAKRLKELCRAKGSGRQLASAAILKEASASEVL